MAGWQNKQDSLDWPKLKSDEPDDLEQVIEVDGGVNPNAFAVFMLMIGGFFREPTRIGR